MFSNCSYGEHSSSPDPSYVSVSWDENEDRGFLEICQCGGTMFLAQETEPAHRGRPYYKCQNHGDDSSHNSKWWDEAIEDEIRSLKTITTSHTDRLYGLQARLEASVEPFSTRFSQEVTRFNFLISTLARDLELVDQKYADLCNVTGVYESRRGWMKHAFERANGPAATAIEGIYDKLRFSSRAFVGIVAVLATIAGLYAFPPTCFA